MDGMVKKVVVIRVPVEELPEVDMTTKEYVQDVLQYVKSGDLEFTHTIEEGDK